MTRHSLAPPSSLLQANKTGWRLHFSLLTLSSEDLKFKEAVLKEQESAAFKVINCKYWIRTVTIVYWEMFNFIGLSLLNYTTLRV